MPFANLNGLNLHYQISGEGPKLVIIHGFTSNSAFWYLTIVPALAREFNIVTYDLRGHGKSDMPPTGYSSAQMATDLLGLMDHLALRRAHLIGHSFGGEIALQLASRHPERVTSVILADARVRSLQPIRPLVQGPSWADVRKKLEELGIEIPRNKRDSGENFYEELANSHWPGAWNPYNRDSESFGPLGLGRYGKRSVQHWIRLYCSTSAEDDLRSTAGLTEERIRQVKAPMLAIYGDRSGFLPTMNRISRIVPNCETCVIPGVGHLLPVVAPRLFVHHVRRFLTALHEGRQHYAAHR